MQNKISFRPPDVSDKSFIFNSWLKSFRNSPLAKPLCNEVYFSNHKLIVENILKRSKIVIACSDEDPMQIFGYTIYEELPGGIIIMHYIYTKYTYRKLGIAQQLYDIVVKNDDPILYSHHTQVVDKVKDKLNLLYDPYRM